MVGPSRLMSSPERYRENAPDYQPSSSKSSFVLDLILGGRLGPWALVGGALVRRESPLTDFTVLFRVDTFLCFLRFFERGFFLRLAILESVHD